VSNDTTKVQQVILRSDIIFLLISTLSQQNTFIWITWYTYARYISHTCM